MSESDYANNGYDSPAPFYSDVSERQQGFTESTLQIIELWNHYKELYNGDMEKVGEAFDIFLLACAARLSGSSAKDCADIIAISYEASDILTR